MVRFQAFRPEILFLRASPVCEFAAIHGPQRESGMFRALSYACLHRTPMHLFGVAAAGKKSRLLWYPEDNHSLDNPASDADYWANTAAWFLEHVPQDDMPPL